MLWVAVTGPSIKSGTWNISEHPGTSNNYDNYEKKMCKIIFWTCSHNHLERSDWSSDIMFLFAGRTTLPRNECVQKNCQLKGI